MYERLLNKDKRPTHDELASYCGKNAELFTSLHTFLSGELDTISEIRFPYGKEYGWSICHRKGKKFICDIFAENGSFTVMVRCSTQQYESIYDNVQDYMKNYIDHKYPCGDGGWIQYSVINSEHLDDIKKLLIVKCRLKSKTKKK